MRRGRFALVGVLTLVLVGCSGGGQPSPIASSLSDINAQPRDALRDGGTLRLPLSSLPDNFNFPQTDGTNTLIFDISRAALPAAFRATEDGRLRLDNDFFTAAELTSAEPQVVTYTINPKATWSDGKPITWRDFESYWRAQNGTNPAFQVSSITGYRDIGSVVRGVDDRQAVVSFRKHFAEWRSLFDPLTPASLTGDPASFNTAWKTSLPISAGPMRVEAMDPAAKTITLTRNPVWWGAPAKLDRVLYRVIDPAAEPDALANNELDYYDTGSSIDLVRRAQSTPGAVLRNASAPTTNTLTLNGAPGAILADPALRRAVGQGLDRTTLTQRMIGSFIKDATSSGNHLYRPGTPEYRDNAAEVLPYDPAAAERALDELGWRRPAPGATRVKDGKPLNLRYVYAKAQTNLEILKTIQNQLGQVGVAIIPEERNAAEISDNIYKGNFDLAVIIWHQGGGAPLSGGVSLYSTPTEDNVRQNYGRISNPEIDRLFDQAIQELDDTKRAELGNQIDRLIWREVHSLPLYNRPGSCAVRAGLANYGAFGLAEINWANVGFVK